LQRAAWRAGLDAADRDALVAAPTSAGKSLVAEVVAVGRLLRGERVLWLAPTRALAESLAARIGQTLEPLGLRVEAAIGGRAGPDRLAATEAQADLIVAVYEKAWQWLGRRRAGWGRVGLVVADELGMLRDERRGGRLDALLTLLADAPCPPRRLGLCAPGAEAAALHAWWGGLLVESPLRPRPLREGVLDAENGVFRWRDRQAAWGRGGELRARRPRSQDSQTVPDADADDVPDAEGREPLAPPDAWRARLARAAQTLDWDADAQRPDGAETARALASLACVALLAGRGEPTLLFAPTRSAARAWAGALAKLLAADAAQGASQNAPSGAPPGASQNASSGAPPPDVPPSPVALQAAALARREPCADHAQLAELLAAGVACHHADLSGPARALAEEAFATGQARAMVATATLAHGLNLLAVNVVQWPWIIREEAGGQPRPAPLERWRWREQGGRAARLGLGVGAGRSLLVAVGASDARRLARRYLAGEPGAPMGPWAADGLESLVLGGLAGRAAGRAEGDLLALARSSYAASAAAGQSGSSGDMTTGRLSENLAAALEACREAGLVVTTATAAPPKASPQSPRRWRLTLSGRLCVEHGLEVASWRALAPWLAVEAQSDPALAAGGDDPEDTLPAIWALALAAPPGYWPAAGPGRGALARRRAAEWLASRAVPIPPPLEPLLLGREPVEPAALAALAAGWPLARWIGPEPTPEIERATGWSAGMLQRAGQGLAWLAHALASAGLAHGWPRERAWGWRRLGTRLAAGAGPDGIALAEMGADGLGRHALRRLLAEGIDAPAALVEADPAWLAGLLQDEAAARRLRAAAIVAVRRERSRRAWPVEQPTALRRAHLESVGKEWLKPSREAALKRASDSIRLDHPPAETGGKEKPAEARLKKSHDPSCEVVGACEELNFSAAKRRRVVAVGDRRKPTENGKTPTEPRSGEGKREGSRTVHQASKPEAMPKPRSAAAPASPGGPLLELDLQSPGLARLAGREMQLSPLTWDLLAVLAASPGRVLTRELLCLRLWPDEDAAPQPQQLDAHRRRLERRITEQLGGARRDEPLIQIVRGIGLRLNLAAGQVALRRG
jgi:replicative superfamily II helicase